MKEVLFDTYCKECKHEKLEEFKEPCNTCLESPMREGTEVPVNFIKKKKRDDLE